MNELATNPDAMAGMLSGMILISGLIGLAVYVASVIGMWKVFAKAGHEGWKAIIPFLNFYVMVQIAGRPMWFLWAFIGGILISWIPVIGWIVSIAIFALMIIINLDIAKRFGKSQGFGIGMALLPFVFYLILGFDENAQYSNAIENNNDFDSNF